MSMQRREEEGQEVIKIADVIASRANSFYPFSVYSKGLLGYQGKQATRKHTDTQGSDNGEPRSHSMPDRGLDRQ